MSNLRYFLLQLRTKLWLKPALTGLGAVVWVEVALIGGRYLNFTPPLDINREILLQLLGILASTMLTVAIFAVSAMVAAFSSVTTTASPRATRVVMQDRSSQNTLAAFLSAFIFAIVALVALSAVAFGPVGRLALFAGYVFVVGWVLFSFVHWVDEISKLGRMNDTIHRVEEACLSAIDAAGIVASLGAKVALGEAPEGTLIYPPDIGYVQHIDVAEVQKIAVSLDTTIRLLVRPGAFVDRHRPLAVVPDGCSVEEEIRKKLSRSFTLGEQRHVEDDPRCGMLMLAEIADRALSPAVNDPGTAIAVVGSLVRILSHWVDVTGRNQDCEFPNVEIPPLLGEDLMDDGFTPISRDGAGMFEVGVRLQKALGGLGRLGHPGLAAAAKHHSRLALEQAMAKLPTEYHRQKLREIAATSFPDTPDQIVPIA